jgi:hypothetical protein
MTNILTLTQTIEIGGLPFCACLIPWNKRRLADKITELGWGKIPDLSGEQTVLGDCSPVPRSWTPLLPPIIVHRKFAGRYGIKESSRRAIVMIFIVVSADGPGTRYKCGC